MVYILLSKWIHKQKHLRVFYDVSILSLSTNDLIMGCSKSDFPTINDKSQTGKWNFIFWYWTVNRWNMKLAVTAKLGEALVGGVRRDDWESDEGWAATSKGLRRRGLTIFKKYILERSERPRREWMRHWEPWPIEDWDSCRSP